MLDKYFGFLKLQDEKTVMQSIIEHTRIDEEELIILESMIQDICKDNILEIPNKYASIRKINEDNSRVFETISDEIIQANFDHQKQYDLLRIHQRVAQISNLIISTAKRLQIFYKIGATLPPDLHGNMKKLASEILSIHKTHTKVLKNYIEQEREVISAIHKVIEQEHYIDHIRSECLEILFRLGNTNNIPMGNFMIIQEIIEQLENIAYAIESCTSSLDWLLLK